MGKVYKKYKKLRKKLDSGKKMTEKEKEFVKRYILSHGFNPRKSKIYAKIVE